MVVVVVMMMQMSKLQNWYCDDGSGQVMRRSSSFKATEDIDPYLNLGHHLVITFLSFWSFWSLRILRKVEAEKNSKH